eukprot:m.1411038 g.1411038  ORF g.1411038 m.1411038 type:complete len:352 (-) comp25028_c0_seq4:2574-3629(-)
MLLDALRSCPSLASMDCLFKQRMLEETTAVVCASSLSDSRAHSTEFRATLSQNYCVIAFVESPRALAVWSQCGEWVWGARRYDHMGNDLFAHRLPACSACYPQYCPLPTGTPSWCFAHFEPEGILPTQASVVTTWIGMHYGLVLQHHKDLQGLRYVKNFWIVESMVLIVLGTGIHFAGWKINKQLWSPSYLCVTAGANGLLLVLMFGLLDYRDWQHRGPCFRRFPYALSITSWLRPFSWVGKNTILIYLLSAAGMCDQFLNLFYWDDNKSNTIPQAAYANVFCHGSRIDTANPLCVPDNLKSLSGTCSICDGGIFQGSHERWAMLVWVLLRIAFWVGVAGLLHRHRWYWAL